MKYYIKIAFLSLVTFSLTSCSYQNVVDRYSSQNKVLNRYIKQENGERFLTGQFTQDALNQKYYSSWYQPEYESYEVEEDKLKEIRKDIRKYDIEVFVGTWCSNSQRELPRLYKILDHLKFPTNSRLKVYGVDRNKKSFYGEEIGKNISHVPTIIFYLKGEEVGRIVESPVSGYLEEDIAMIIKGTPLTPNYSED